MSATLRRRARWLERYPSLYPAARVLTVVLAALIVVLSLVEDPTRATGGSDLGAWLSRLLLGTDAYGDKVGHLLAYAALGGLALVAFGRHRREAVLVVLALLLTGAALELAQAAGGVRRGELADLAANAAGVAIGVGAGSAARLAWRRAGLSAA